MAVQQKVTIQGTASIGPAQASCSPFPSMESVINIGVEKYYGVNRSMVRSIASPASYIDLLAGLGITAVRLLVMRVQAGTLTVRVTSTAGADQVFPLSDLLLLSCPVEGTQLTAVAVQGTANIEVLIAGE